MDQVKHTPLPGPITPEMNFSPAILLLLAVGTCIQAAVLSQNEVSYLDCLNLVEHTHTGTQVAST